MDMEDIVKQLAREQAEYILDESDLDDRIDTLETVREDYIKEEDAKNYLDQCFANSGVEDRITELRDQYNDVYEDLKNLRAECQDYSTQDQLDKIRQEHFDLDEIRTLFDECIINYDFTDLITEYLPKAFRECEEVIRHELEKILYSQPFLDGLVMKLAPRLEQSRKESRWKWLCNWLWRE